MGKFFTHLFVAAEPCKGTGFSVIHPYGAITKNKNRLEKEKEKENREWKPKPAFLQIIAEIELASSLS